MPDFKGLTNFDLVVFFVVPGLIISYVRSRFISGRPPSHTENILSYVVLSLFYYSFTIFFLRQALALSTPWVLKAIIWIGLTLLGPAILGFALGAWAQKGYGWRLADRFGFNTVHVIPTAWDWRFSTVPRGGMFVMATLSDGSQIAGFFGENSFASSDKDERDLYIEEEYDVGDDGKWTPRGSETGILILSSDIRYVEFWEPSRD